MAVSKRTRYEVLRRDNFTCRYCRSTDNPLTVDHVQPVALGGTDDPANLVTACRDCNAGKSSTGPDEGTVAEVTEDDIKWAAALARAAEIDADKAAALKDLLSWFEGTWREYMPSFANLPVDWAESVANFRSLGLTEDAFTFAIRRTAGNLSVHQRERFRYFCGICWKKVRELQEMARQLLAVEEG
jgi:hypothetical protein